MNKFSRYVMVFSKPYGHIGTLKSSYNTLRLTNNYKYNSYDNKYLANLFPIRYYSAQPKKQSTNFSEHDKTEIVCKSRDTNNNIDTAAKSIGPVSNIKDVSNLTELASRGIQNKEAPNKITESKSVPSAQKNLTLFQKFKDMYKNYWYVLLPVHVITSAIWLGGFYYVAISGIDIPGLMQSAGISEAYIHPIRDSKLGFIAIAYLLYKVATPLRYTVTLGGTTFAIKYLVKRGHIKPVPTKTELIQKYKDHMVLRRENKKKGN